MHGYPYQTGSIFVSASAVDLSIWRSERAISERKSCLTSNYNRSRDFPILWCPNCWPVYSTAKFACGKCIVLYSM